MGLSVVLSFNQVNDGMIFVAVNEPVTSSVGSSSSNIMSPSLASEIESLSFSNDAPTVIAPVSEDTVLKIISLFNIYMMSKIFSQVPIQAIFFIHCIKLQV